MPPATRITATALQRTVRRPRAGPGRTGATCPAPVLLRVPPVRSGSGARPGIDSGPDAVHARGSVSSVTARSASSVSSAEGRSAGSLASRAVISGSSGPACFIGPTGAVTMEYAVSTGVSLRNGGCPSTA